MLGEHEKDELRQLLKLLSVKELVSLKDTITKKLIRTYAVEETIEAILEYTESIAELLTRKKLSRACLFQYLANKKVPIPGNATKADLIEKALRFLGCDVKVSWQSVKDEATESAGRSETLDIQTESPNIDEQKLALQFATWFYSQLNSNNPYLNQAPLERWGPQHFWNDSKLVLNVNFTADDRTEQYEGSDLVSERLLSMAKEEKLLFNPNVENLGTKGKMNRHGLTMVLVCGTLHRGTDCLGIFEQSFGLIRDPALQNNWKIKHTNLRIQRKDVNHIPTLGQESLRALTAE